MRSLLLFLVLILSPLIGGSPLPAVPAACQRYTFCNGEMCDEICVIGSVETDPWTDSALAFQRSLQFNRSMVLYEMPGTHNGAMAQDYGMGIEEKFLKNLLIPVYGEEKSEVVIANQRHSLLDQLRMGVRHIEIDIYHFRRIGGIRICHWPVFPPDFTILVNFAARQQDMYPLDWEPTNMGCDEKKPFFEEKLIEIRDWLVAPENSNEIIGLYIDNKNVAENHIEEFHEIVMSVFDGLLFTPEHKNTDYPNAWPTVAELVSKSRRVWIENNDESWIGNPIADQHYFTPTIWQQFGPDRFAEYPACTVGNVDYYGKELTRSLDGSLTLGPAFLWEGRTDYPIETIQEMTECSINIQSMDQITPDTMQHFVWSWARNEPNSAYTRVQLTSAGRWKTSDSNLQLPHACVSNSNEALWVLGSTAVWGAGVCPSGYSFGFPPSGLLNTKLAVVANGAQVWLNYRV